MSIDGGYEVSLTRPARLDARTAEAIDALAAEALEPNVFYESWMLGPALEHVRVPELALVAIRHRTHGLTGVFPLELARYHGLPLRCLRSWLHEYAFLGTPLIARAHAQATIDALLDWLASRRSPAPILELRSRADGAFGTLLADALARRPAFASHRFAIQRAMLDLRADLGTGMSHKHEKELRRQERRLGDFGALAYRALARDEAPQEWIERFLALEAAGWKGEEGTALASDPESRAYFFEIAAQAHRQGRLEMLELTLDGAPIAAKCNFVAGEGSFAFKIAHDERYAKYSPGVLLEIFNMKHMAAQRPEVAWMDSCARAQHFMINRLWPRQLTIGLWSISARNPLARAVVRHRARFMSARAKARSFFAGSKP